MFAWIAIEIINGHNIFWSFSWNSTNYDIYADLITVGTLISKAVKIKDLGFITQFNLFLLIVVIMTV